MYGVKATVKIVDEERTVLPGAKGTVAHGAMPDEEGKVSVVWDWAFTKGQGATTSVTTQCALEELEAV